jgi:autotransporter family porin
MAASCRAQARSPSATRRSPALPDGTVTGAGSTLAIDSSATTRLYMGDVGTGTLNVTDGATATVKGNADIGATAHASVLVSGGAAFTVTPMGNGSGVLTLGDYSTGNGTVTVTGGGSTLAAGSAVVGNSGTGTLNVLAGASATFRTGP